jgi:hypothetical protein
MSHRIRVVLECTYPENSEGERMGTVARAVKAIWDVLITIGLTVFIIGFGLGAIQKSTGWHWLLGVAVTVVCCLGVASGIHVLRDPAARHYPIHVGLAVSLATAFIAMAVAASISLLLRHSGWAEYGPNPLSEFPNPLVEYEYLAFFSYYVWVLLDMLPGLQAPELLGFQVPIKPENAVAGIPVIAFRAVVIFGLLDALKSWWVMRKPERAV